MKLTYRSLNYHYEPPTIDMMEGEFGGMYRGCKWEVRYPRHIPVPQPVQQLKYRGVAYCSGQTQTAAMPARTTTAGSIAVVASSNHTSNASDRQLIEEEVSKIHRANICRSLEQRLKAAEAKGDKKLIQILEEESKQLTCSLNQN